MKQYLNYEPSPFPLSLFTLNGFRKNVKADLFDEFTSANISPPSRNTVHVVDGGFLLLKVVWLKNETIKKITEQYVKYVSAHYGNNNYIIFDGYPDSYSASVADSTKTVELLQRKKLSCVPNFQFQINTKIPFTKEKILF